MCPLFKESASSRTVSPSLGSCPASAVLRASFRLAPCYPHHDLLREPRWTRRAMCPTNFCHPNDDTCTRTSCVPDSLRGFHRVDVTPFGGPACAGHEVLGFVRLDRGTECFTALENASADRGETRAAFFCPSLAPLRVRSVRVRAWAFSSHGACSDQASDTSVATPSYVALAGPSLCLPALVSSSSRAVAFAPLST